MHRLRLLLLLAGGQLRVAAASRRRRGIVLAVGHQIELLALPPLSRALPLVAM